MMDREKAKHIDAFKYWCETNEENGVITLPKFLCEHIVEILDDTNARPHGEWIPCSERLPEEIGDYLVTDYHGNVYCSSFDYILREKCFNYEDDGYTVEDDTVVAWMPLPEPYKKEGEAE